jgi:hypothetical protein
MRALLEIVNDWQEAKSVEESCVADATKLLDCGEHEAVDILNNFDRHRLEVYQDEPDVLIFDSQLPAKTELALAVLSIVLLTAAVALWLVRQ